MGRYEKKMLQLLPKDNSITDKDWLELSWNYFSLLSGQRMSMLDFYIVLETALIGAVFALLNLDDRMLWAELTVSFAICFTSITFFILDCRTKAMIHCCEEIIRDIEKKYYPQSKQIRLPFHLIDYKTDRMRIRMTYSRIFRIHYFVIGCWGAILFLYLLF